MSTPSRKRRTPKQERSTLRRAAILDAAARLLDRVGYDGATTTAVAEEAGASVGTVYEYFPDRDALARALLDRYRERLRAMVDTMLDGWSAASWRETASGAVDAFVRFYVEEPGYRVLWLESLTTPALREAGAAWSVEFGAKLALVLGRGARLSPRRRRAVAQVCMYLVSGLTSMALAGDPKMVTPIVRETKLALERYLETVLSRRS